MYKYIPHTSKTCTNWGLSSKAHQRMLSLLRCSKFQLCGYFLLKADIRVEYMNKYWLCVKVWKKVNCNSHNTCKFEHLHLRKVFLCYY